MQVRITKYDPILRDPDGAFCHDDWTSISDIGVHDDLSKSIYLQVEENYWLALSSMLQSAGLTEVHIRDVELYGLDDFVQHGNDLIRISAQILAGSELPETMSIPQFKPYFQAVMRETVWFKVLAEGNSFIHFGYDYYLYFGSDRKFDWVEVEGIFVEEFASPLYIS